MYGYTLLDGAVLDESIGDELSNRSTTLHNSYLNGTNASKLEVSTGWLASTTVKLPERITGVTIQPNGIGPEEPMTPGGTMPSVMPEPFQTPTIPNTPTNDPEGGAIGATDEPVTGAVPDRLFTYEEALAALENGMPYYEAFCIRYEPTTDGGRSQCAGIEAGTVDPVTDEYIGE